MGLVPELELREAAIYSLYNWNTWIELPYNEKIAAVAHYRVHLLIEAHINDAMDKASRRGHKGAN